MNNLGYYNGIIGLIEEISVPITDRAFYFGDGVYEAVLCRNNIPYLLFVHLERFYRNCGKLDIQIPMEREELELLIKELVKTTSSASKSSFTLYLLSQTAIPCLFAHLISSALATPGKIWQSVGCVIISPFFIIDTLQ